jgi:nifR3 family TIM-barrel protein
LLRDPAKVGRLIAALSRALPVPVTAKIRLGWDEKSRNYLEVARAIEQNGGALIAVHARTRAQRYRGQADWDAIAEIKAALSIPVIGNGDVRTPEDIARLKAHSGCDAVMIGRGAVGNPWIFQRRDRWSLPLEELARVIHQHLESMLAYYGPSQGLLLFRKHLKRYLAPLHPGRALLRRILTCENHQELLDLLRQAGLPMEAHPLPPHQTRPGKLAPMAEGWIGANPTSGAAV